jgi:predicted TIM-barrel fold metal-dependent hydrolase
MPADLDQIPIIDAHHHYWDPRDGNHPWLTGNDPIPFRYGDYSAICRPFLPEDYAVVSKGLNVVATVTIEGEWDEADPVAESRWISNLASRTGRPEAHVARAFLHEKNTPEVLAGHAAFPLVRGVRHKPTAAASPGTLEPGAHGSMSDPAWLAGYRELAPNGLHYELQAPWWHVGELLDVIERFPETPIVINHCFMPVDRSSKGLAHWRQAIGRAASAPNVTMKISGIGIKGRRWALEDQRPIIDACLEAFGASRCLFASNFPVDSLVGTFTTIYQGFLEATHDLAQHDRLALFHDNAVRIYRLDRAPLARQTRP